MFKKISLLILFTCASGAFGMASLDELNRQLQHIKMQMLVIRRAWNTARLRMKIAEKRLPNVYQSIKPTFDTIISSNDFTTKLETLASEQSDAITNYASFASRTFELSDYFPNVTMNQFGKTLFSAMAEKAYYLMLGKKLAQKIQEITMTITSIQQQQQQQPFAPVGP